MTASEWEKWFKDCSEPYLGVANLIADLAAVEAEFAAYKADCCATHEADNELNGIRKRIDAVLGVNP